MTLIIFLSIVFLMGILAEMLTYKVGQGGGVTRFYRAYKSTNIDLAVAFVLSVAMLLQRNTPALILGLIIYIPATVIAVIRFDKRIMREAEE